jgi:hypothetical protein
MLERDGLPRKAHQKFAENLAIFELWRPMGGCGKSLYF